MKFIVNYLAETEETEATECHTDCLSIIPDEHEHTKFAAFQLGTFYVYMNIFFRKSICLSSLQYLVNDCLPQKMQYHVIVCFFPTCSKLITENLSKVLKLCTYLIEISSDSWSTFNQINL